MKTNTDLNITALREKAAQVAAYAAAAESKAVSLITALYAKTSLAALLPPPEDVLGFVVGMEQRSMSVYSVRNDLDLTKASIPFLCQSDQEVLQKGIDALQGYCDMLDGEANPNPMLDQAIGGCAAALLRALLDDENLSVVDVKEGLESQGLPTQFITSVMHRLNVVVAYLAANA